MNDYESMFLNAINKAISQFEWDRVEKTMHALDWKWYTMNEFRVPTKEEMIEIVRDLGNDCIANWDCINEMDCGTGGFVVSIGKHGNYYANITFKITNTIAFA